MPLFGYVPICLLAARLNRLDFPEAADVAFLVAGLCVDESRRQFFRQRNRTRLSPAALETLAIVAYRQPITAPEIQAIRGVDATASLKSLLEKKLVRILGKKKVVGSPLLYGTSRHFLVHFGLNALGDLPPIDEFNAILGSLEDSSVPASAPSVAATRDDAAEESEGGTPIHVSDEE